MKKIKENQKGSQVSTPSRRFSITQGQALSKRWVSKRWQEGKGGSRKQEEKKKGIEEIKKRKRKWLEKEENWKSKKGWMVQGLLKACIKVPCVCFQTFVLPKKRKRKRDEWKIAGANPWWIFFIFQFIFCSHPLLLLPFCVTMQQTEKKKLEQAGRQQQESERKRWRPARADWRSWLSNS